MATPQVNLVALLDYLETRLHHAPNQSIEWRTDPGLATAVGELFEAHDQVPPAPPMPMSSDEYLFMVQNHYGYIACVRTKPAFKDAVWDALVTDHHLYVYDLHTQHSKAGLIDPGVPAKRSVRGQFHLASRNLIFGRETFPTEDFPVPTGPKRQYVTFAAGEIDIGCYYKPSKVKP